MDATHGGPWGRRERWRRAAGGTRDQSSKGPGQEAWTRPFHEGKAARHNSGQKLGFPEVPRFLQGILQLDVDQVARFVSQLSLDSIGEAVEITIRGYVLAKI